MKSRIHQNGNTRRTIPRAMARSRVEGRACCRPQQRLRKDGTHGTCQLSVIQALSLSTGTSRSCTRYQTSRPTPRLALLR